MKGGIGKTWESKAYNLDTVVYQFLETGTSDVSNASFNAWDSQVSSYTPFHFSFTISLIILNQFHVTLVKTVFFRLFVSSSTCSLYSIYETKQDATFWKVYSPEHFLPWNYSKYYKKVFLNFNLSGQSMRLNGNAYLTKLKLHVSRFSVKSGVFLQKIFF